MAKNKGPFPKVKDVKFNPRQTPDVNKQEKLPPMKPSNDGIDIKEGFKSSPLDSGGFKGLPPFVKEEGSKKS